MLKTSAYGKALSLLAYSDTSEKKLREKLFAKGFEEDEIAEALDELRAEGYLSDDRLIENLFAYYAKKKFFGRYRIRLELLEKFDRESVDRNFDSLCELYDFAEIAREYAEKEASRDTDREKLIRKLQRLGHDASAIRRALAEILS